MRETTAKQRALLPLTAVLIFLLLNSQALISMDGEQSPDGNLLGNDITSTSFLSQDGGSSQSFFDINGNSSANISWTKQLNSGYLSTAPLISNGVVVVKSPVGLHAFFAANGSDLWFAAESSKWGFEMGPLTFVDRGDLGGGWNSPLVVTGWSTGRITAHSLLNGSLQWAVESSAPVNGIHGRIILQPPSSYSAVPLLLVPIENGSLGLNPYTGEEIWQVPFPNSTLGYRHSITPFETQDGLFYAMGDDEGRVTVWNSSHPHLANTYSLSNISGAKIRSNIISLSDGRLLVPIQSPSGGSLIEWQIGDNTTLNEFHLNGSTGLNTERDGLVIVSSSRNSSLYDCTQQCRYAGELTNTPVTGEVKIIGGEENTSLTAILPINQNNGRLQAQQIIRTNGSWQIANSTSWVWNPETVQYLTAGIGLPSDGGSYAYVMCNDASYIESVVNDALEANRQYVEMLGAWNNTTNISAADNTEEGSEEGTGGDAGGADRKEASTEEEVGAEEAGKTFFAEAYYSAVIITAVASIIVIASLKYVRVRQSNVKWGLTLFSTILLLTLIFTLPLIQQSVNESIAEDGTARDDGEWPDDWAGTQVIGFKFEPDIFPSQYAGYITLLDGQGNVISQVATQDINSELWVGGLKNNTTVLDLTESACTIANIDLIYHGGKIGVRVDKIALAVDGEDDRWLLYYENDVLAALGVDANSIEGNATVIWVYL